MEQIRARDLVRSRMSSNADLWSRTQPQQRSQHIIGPGRACKPRVCNSGAVRYAAGFEDGAEHRALQETQVEPSEPPLV